MSLVINSIQASRGILRTSFLSRFLSLRRICISSPYFNTENNTTNAIEETNIDPSKDRTREISVETSIRYMNSKAYQECYGDDPVWKHYRRNHKGGRPPRMTRTTCIRKGVISAGSPCPICRDEYLVLDHRNVKLLKQFVSPYNGEVLCYSTTQICQKQHNKLLIAMYRAKDYGTITFDVPIRQYDYAEWNNTTAEKTTA